MKTKLLKQCLLGTLAAACLLISCRSAKQSEKEATLKEAFAGKFYIGTALNEAQITGRDTVAVQIVKDQFNAIVPENCMKSENIQPREGVFDFILADQFVDIGEQNNLFVTGHCLIWHSQAPAWFFTDDQGKDVSADVLIQRMKNHIYTVVGRYKGRVKGWDVVNEAILEDGSYRKSKFYEIIGEEYIPLAFQFAHEADPQAELYYNDYNEWFPGKRDAIVKMIHSLKERGIRIDGVGMQGHLGIDGPSVEVYEAAILAYANTGVKVMITELDVTVLPFPQNYVGAEVSDNFKYQEELNPYVNGLSDSVLTVWNCRMDSLFDLFLKHSDKISRVTVWGVTDGDSWKNNWPVHGRTDYPLLIDRNYKLKPFLVIKTEKPKSGNENGL